MSTIPPQALSLIHIFKLYFMMGLPTETMEDIEGIAETAQKVVDLYYKKMCIRDRS